jgi:hypothetical protein
MVAPSFIDGDFYVGDKPQRYKKQKTAFPMETSLREYG